MAYTHKPKNSRETRDFIDRGAEARMKVARVTARLLGDNQHTFEAVDPFPEFKITARQAMWWQVKDGDLITVDDPFIDMDFRVSIE